MLRLLFSLLILCLPFALQAASSVDAQKVDKTQKQLEQTQKEIEELQKRLRQIEQEKSGLQKQLKQTETEMGTQEQQIRELKEQIDADETALKQLDDDQSRLQTNYQTQRERIARHSRAIWQSGGQSTPLRLFLNAEQPSEVTRTLTYYHYLGQARQREIDSINATLAALDKVKQKTLERKAQLDKQQQALDAKHQQLVKLREQRRTLLANLNKQQQNRATRLKVRKQEQTELSLVLQTLQAALAQQAKAEAEAKAAAAAKAKEVQLVISQNPSQSTQSSPFAQTRGKLPWPVSGRLLARYGSPRSDDARVKWDGVLIGAAEGSTVRAIHPGQVVLADYLSGMGLMLIINHGSNYLSLYGHNQSLLKRVGDLVQAGEPIATVGKSGGQAEPALYFAIRHQKNPSDPANWCIAQN